MTCAHVRLLGPCFKTGRVEGRPNRHRPNAAHARRPVRTHAVGEHCKQSTPVERTQGTTGRTTAVGSSVPELAENHLTRSVTPQQTGQVPPAATFPQRLLAAREPVVALHSGKVHSPATAERPTSRGVFTTPSTPCAAIRQVEFPE